VRRVTLITIIALFVLLGIVAVVQINASRGDRLPCQSVPQCRSPAPSATSSG
jgi:hypothetical protein